MHISIRKASIILAVAIGLAAGCSGEAPEPAATSPTAPTPSTSPTPTGRPADGGAFSSTAGLQSALAAVGLTCSGLRPPADPPADGVERGFCQPGSAEDVILAVYPAGSTALAEEVAAVETMTYARSSILAGRNWTIVGPDAFVESARAALGGELTTSPAS